jgi:hypothetical protein
MPILSAMTALASGGIDDDFRMYYRQRVLDAPYHGPLGFLQEAAAAHTDAEKMLKAGASRTAMLDRGNGYLQIEDSSNTDQILTMAVYPKTGGTLLLIVGSSDCDDVCEFSVEPFVVSANDLQAVPLHSVIPAIEPRQFIKPGHTMPKELATITPSIDYVPARIGTTLTLKPWYGYEAEVQMKTGTRAAIGNVVLDWDADLGRFALRPPRPAPGGDAAPPPPASRHKGPSPPR